MKLNIVHKRNRFRGFKPASSLSPDALASGEVGCIESFRFIDHDELLLRHGDKRQRRRKTGPWGVWGDVVAVTNEQAKKRTRGAMGFGVVYYLNGRTAKR